MGRALAGGAWLAAGLAGAACLPRERVNAACRWTGDAAALAAPGTAARRAHLLEDVRVAQDLGIRFADATAGRVFDDAWRRSQARCTAASFDEIARGHHVSRAELDAATSGRELWVDLLAVFLPMAALFVAATRVVVGRLVAGYAPGERAGAAALLAFWAPCAAALALGVTQIWGVLVEMMRLANGHISYRASGLPASRHAWLVWGAAVGLFATVAAASLARTPAAARGRRPSRLTIR